jgi:hypothetical protein
MTTKSDANGPDQRILDNQLALQKKLTRSIFMVIGATVVVITLFFLFQTSETTQESADSLSIANNGVKLSNEDLEQYRQAFIRQLDAFNQNQQPWLDNPHLQAWASYEADSIESMKEQALVLFAKSSFRAASDSIEKAKIQTQALVSEWDQAYEKAIDEADSFLSAQKINQARLAFARASQINPEKHLVSPKALALKNSIDNFEKLAELLDELSIAEIENNTDKQIVLLTQLVNIDPSQTQKQARLAQLTKQKAEQQLAGLVAQAHKAVDDQNYSRASELVKQAKRLNANAVSIKTVVDRLNVTRSERQLDTRKNEIKQLISAERWQDVLLKSQEYQQLHTNIEVFSDAYNKANIILRQQRLLAPFLEKPDRLSDAGVRETAISRLQQAMPYMSESKKLTEDIVQLGQFIDAASEPISVEITSDGDSYIVVIGVGHVGAVKQKNIQLTPGSYTLEARKNGFKTVRQTIEVGVSKQNQFYIACNEVI